jgi:HAD superfamily hydrolase (TIGR01484 family)
LAPIDGPIFTIAQEWIRKNRGRVRTAINSGKPLPYLAGFARAQKLEDTILIGENGLQIQSDPGFPPKSAYSVAVPADLGQKLARLGRDMQQVFAGDTWFQMSQLMIIVVFSDLQTQQRIGNYLEEHVGSDPDLVVFDHCDCFEVCPKGIDKGIGLDLLANHYGIGHKDMIAIGDSTNDVPMFAKAGTSIGIVGGEDIAFDYPVDYRATSIEEVLEIVNRLID